MIVARASVEGSAHRVSDNPVKAALVGLAAELLFVPILVLTCIVLAVTIVGIPLLFLVPFAVLFLLLVAMAGFTGTALAIGQWARRVSASPRRQAFRMSGSDSDHCSDPARTADRSIGVCGLADFVAAARGWYRPGVPRVVDRSGSHALEHLLALAGTPRDQNSGAAARRSVRIVSRPHPTGNRAVCAARR